MGIKKASGTERVLFFIKNIERANKREIRRAWFMVGRLLKSTASRNIKHKPRFGRKYRFRGREHIASVAGESFAERSGDTRRAMFYKTTSWRRMTFGNKSKVGFWMEFGTPTIEPRPAHIISIRQNNRNIINILEKHVGIGLGK